MEPPDLFSVNVMRVEPTSGSSTTKFNDESENSTPKEKKSRKRKKMALKYFSTKCAVWIVVLLDCDRRHRLTSESRRSRVGQSNCEIFVELRQLIVDYSQGHKGRRFSFLKHDASTIGRVVESSFCRTIRRRPRNGCLHDEKKSTNESKDFQLLTFPNVPPRRLTERKEALSTFSATVRAGVDNSITPRASSFSKITTSPVPPGEPIRGNVLSATYKRLLIKEKLILFFT